MRTDRIVRLLAVSALTVIEAACSLPGGPEGRKAEVGVIRFYSHPTQIDVSDTVALNQDMTVRVVTYGNSCMERAGEEVKVDGLLGWVTPLVYVPGGSGTEVCGGDLRTFEHLVRLRFRETGNATVVVRGREAPADSMIEVRFAVVVR